MQGLLLILLQKNKELYLLTIYDKSEFENIDDKTLRKIIKDIQDEK